MLLLSRQKYVVEDLQVTTGHEALPEEEQQSYFLTCFATFFVLCFLLPLVVIPSVMVQSSARCSWATVLVPLVLVLCLLASNILLLLTYGDSSLDGDGEELYVPYMVSF